MLIELSLMVVTLLWAYYNHVFVVMTSLLYDAVAINRTDAVDLLIELFCLAHIRTHRPDVTFTLGTSVRR